MGCWNEICNLSGLPVAHGDKVASLFLYENLLREGGSDTNLYFHAAPFLIYGKYDDYGGVEKIRTPIRGWIQNWMQASLKQKTSSFKLEDYFEMKKEACGRGVELLSAGILKDYLKDPRSPHPRLFNILILQSVLDKVFAEYTWREYNAEKGDYDILSYKDYVASIEEFYDICAKYYGSQKVIISHTPSHRELGRNLIGHAVRKYHEHEGGMFFRMEFVDTLRAIVSDKHREQFHLLLEEFSKFAMIHKVMKDTHRAFIVGPSGHQDTSTDAQRFMASLTIEVGRMIDQRYEE